MNAQGTAPGLPGKPYVLLVEDEVEDEALAQRVLKKYRIANHVEWVRDGEEALRVLKERLGGGLPGHGRSAPGIGMAMAKLRALEASSPGNALLPPGDAPRPADRGPSDRAAGAYPGRDPKPGNGGPPARAGYAPEMVLLSFSQAKTPALEVVRRLRALPGMENVPVALCCRSQEEEKAVRESGLPRVCQISKPIGFFKLLECIQKMDMHWFVFAEKP